MHHSMQHICICACESSGNRTWPVLPVYVNRSATSSSRPTIVDATRSAGTQLASTALTRFPHSTHLKGDAHNHARPTPSMLAGTTPLCSCHLTTLRLPYNAHHMVGVHNHRPSQLHASCVFAAVLTGLAGCICHAGRVCPRQYSRDHAF